MIGVGVSERARCLLGGSIVGVGKIFVSIANHGLISSVLSLNS